MIDQNHSVCWLKGQGEMMFRLELRLELWKPTSSLIYFKEYIVSPRFVRHFSVLKGFLSMISAWILF